MIKTISIKNFQSHVNTELLLCPGLNLLIGEGGSGKSSIMRSFELLRTSRPLGIEKRSWFTKNNEPIEISLSFFNDTPKITFVHGPKTPRTYTIGDTKYSVIGKDIPDMVKELLNIPDIAIQSQGSKHFFLFAGPTEIAKEINNVSGLQAVDPAIASINRKIKQCEYDIESKESKLQELTNELKSLHGIEASLAKVNKLEVLNKKLQSIDERVITLNKLTSSLNVAYAKKRGFKHISNEKIEDLTKLLHKYNTIKITIEKVNKLIGTLKSLTQKKKSIAVELSDTEKRIKQVFLSTGRCPLCLSKITNVRDVIEKL